jgi:hypothetical protein
MFSFFMNRNLKLWVRWIKGHVIAQVISHWLPTVVTHLWDWFRSNRICGGQSGTGVGFNWVLRFLLPVTPPTAPLSSSPIIQGWYIKPVADVTKWTKSHPTLRNVGKAVTHLTCSFEILATVWYCWEATSQEIAPSKIRRLHHSFVANFTNAYFSREILHFVIRWYTSIKKKKLRGP